MKKNKIKQILFILIFLCYIVPMGFPIERFPHPEFTSQYEIPSPEHPDARGENLAYLDASVLLLGLCIASFFALKKRSRHGLYFLGIFSIIYFGFYKKGCVCSIGSIQNVTISFFDSGYIIPFNILIIFFMPLLISLFFGRVFCSSLCPLGAIQEIMIYKHRKIPFTIKHILSLIPFLYLGMAVLFAALDKNFFICKYDPFIGFYRFGAPYYITISGCVLLLIGVFYARPYCRFLCPYGVLLGICSSFSRRHLTITPHDCIKCKLCENSCPVDAIEIPSPKIEEINKKNDIKKIAYLIILMPVFIFITGYSFSRISRFMSKGHATIKLALQIKKEEANIIKTTTLDSDAFKGKGEPIQKLYNDAERLKINFKTGSWILGLYMGLVIAIKLIMIMRVTKREDYEPDKFNCLSCGRCMEYCPQKNK